MSILLWSLHKPSHGGANACAIDIAHSSAHIDTNRTTNIQPHIVADHFTHGRTHFVANRVSFEVPNNESDSFTKRESHDIAHASTNDIANDLTNGVSDYVTNCLPNICADHAVTDIVSYADT